MGHAVSSEDVRHGRIVDLRRRHVRKRRRSCAVAHTAPVARARPEGEPRAHSHREEQPRNRREPVDDASHDDRVGRREGVLGPRWRGTAVGGARDLARKRAASSRREPTPPRYRNRRGPRSRAGEGQRGATHERPHRRAQPGRQRGRPLEVAARSQGKRGVLEQAIVASSRRPRTSIWTNRQALAAPTKTGPN